MNEPALWRRLAAEVPGRPFLAAIVVGRDRGPEAVAGNVGLQLFENAAATAAGLFAIILMFGGVSVRTSTRWSRSSMASGVEME